VPAPRRGRGVRPVRRGPLARRRSRTGLLFTLPVVALIGGLLLYPIGQTVYYSFTNWDGLTSQWVGPSTYTHLLHSPEFVRVLENNATILLAIPVAMLLPLAVALLINSHVRGWRLFRSVYFLPTAVSWVVIGFVAVRFFASDGILHSLLAQAGLGFLHPDPLAHERSALLAVMVTFVWSMFGTNLIIFLAGLATIDQEIYDAAKVDGASPAATMFRITIPLLRRFLQFTFVITLITAFTALFSLIFVMTGGGPGFGTTTLEFFIYQNGFAQSYYGLGATAGVVLFIAVFAVSMLQLRLLRAED
jgi:ABC-type sugar transport system permease subunit